MAAVKRRPPALRGRWLEAAARRLFSPESFALLVEPAIADLQLEESPRLAARVDAYATVWIGMAVACDQGVAARTRAFVRDNDLLTLTALVLLHAVHSTWMVVLFLGLDGRVHMKEAIGSALASIPTPGLMTVSSVVTLLLLRAAATRMLFGPAAAHNSITARVAE
jgi:hypothetical protein